ncbi:MAG: flagellar hook-basal body protein [Fibrobacteres bacterium]|jgi:flagellar basal-body rod protein FlgF|nr:flagellar hook-basal body protein [Fibrobacterota bacterium]
MVNGLFTSGAGMMLTMRKQEITSNNMANAQTTGFKISRLATHATVESRRDSDDYMRQREEQRADEVSTDWQSGPMVSTGNSLDVALRGDGFLAIGTPKGERYLRSASMKLTADGTLVDPTGSPVLDQSGSSIQVKGLHNTVTSDGRVVSDGEEVGRLRIVDFPKPYSLRQEGAGRFAPFAASAADPVPTAVEASANTSVEAGFVEGPNVNVVAEMVRMISQFRNYEADSKVMRAVESTIERAVNQVGRV